MLTHLDVRKRFFQFWSRENHAEIPPIPLVPQNDPTTLFTGSGMQQLVPNLLGEPHPLGTRLFNVQRCVRAQDIDEVGDNRHDTFFEMMGNWSLGDYFKQEQIAWFFTFLTQALELDPTRLYVTVFKGDTHTTKDDDSARYWKSQFENVAQIFSAKGITNISVNLNPELGIHPSDRIFFYDASKNWWSRAGAPEQMPEGEVGGPDSEVFFDFDPNNEHQIHEHSRYAENPCHPNCDCGRFIEIGNSVFMQYVKVNDGHFRPLPKMNVDFGGGLERMLMAVQHKSDVFETDVFWPIVQAVSPDYTHRDIASKRHVRIVADHIRTATHLAADGVLPGPKEQGYLMRTLIRRAVRASHALGITSTRLIESAQATQAVFAPVYPHLVGTHIPDIIMREIEKYERTLHEGRKTIAKAIKQKPNLSGTDVFNLYQSAGVSAEEVVDIAQKLGATVNMAGFDEAKRAHATSSRSGSEQKFKGGLADHSEQVIRYHTATHLLHQALFEVLGPSVRQEGSNITGDRLRFDFRCDHKPTPEDILRVSDNISQKVSEQLAVSSVILPKETALQLGAKSFFKEKYPDMVKVYLIGATEQVVRGLSSEPILVPQLPCAYSIELCGGPHVANTKDIGSIQIYKFEKIGTDLYRIYAQ